MSTDPTFTVEWTVPSDADEEWGGDAPDATDPDVRVETAARDTAPTPSDDRLAARDPTNLPPAPVLAARVDHLRSERDARERQLDAVRERYETILADRNAEVRELRDRESVIEAFVRRVRQFF